MEKGIGGVLVMNRETIRTYTEREKVLSNLEGNSQSSHFTPRRFFIMGIKGIIGQDTFNTQMGSPPTHSQRTHNTLKIRTKELFFFQTQTIPD